MSLRKPGEKATRFFSGNNSLDVEFLCRFPQKYKNSIAQGKKLAEMASTRRSG